MAYQRAKWRSGLVYRRECDKCKLRIEYMDDSLDFRPWYPDGFVYCPRCKTPLRHSEAFATSAPPPASASFIPPDRKIPEQPPVQDQARFCHHCGASARPDANFCSNCGTKLEK